MVSYFNYNWNRYCMYKARYTISPRGLSVSRPTGVRGGDRVNKCVKKESKVNWEKPYDRNIYHSKAVWLCIRVGMSRLENNAVSFIRRTKKKVINRKSLAEVKHYNCNNCLLLRKKIISLFQKNEILNTRIIWLKHFVFCTLLNIHTLDVHTSCTVWVS